MMISSEENNNNGQNINVDLPLSTSLPTFSEGINHGSKRGIRGTQEDQHDETGAAAKRLQDQKNDVSLPEFPVRTFAILNFCLIFWSLIGFAVVTYFQISRSPLEEFFDLQGIPVNIPGMFLYMGTITSLVVGVDGIVYAIRGTSILHQIQQHLNGIIAGFYLLGLLYARSAWRSHNKDSISYFYYQRTFEATTIANGSSYFKVLGTSYKTYWDRLQRVFHCCGLEGPHNWIDSEYNCIPNSCCDSSKRKQCEEKLKMCPLGQTSLAVLKNQIWRKDCRTAMLEELEYLELGWGAIATSLLVFHLILAAGANLIVIAAGNRYNMKPQALFRLRVPKIPKIKPRMQKIHFFRRKPKIDFGAQVGEDHEPAGNAAAETEIKPETITTSS